MAHILKANHKAALKTAKERASSDYEDPARKNLAAAYLERDQQYKELRELAKSVVNSSTGSTYLEQHHISALRAAIGEE